VWRDVDEEFFLRERAEDIATFTNAIINNPDNSKPVILLKDVGVEIPIATQIFVYSKDRENIFAITAAALDRLNLNIQDARLYTNSANCAFDVFYVLDEQDQPVSADAQLSAKIIKTLHNAILNPQAVSYDVQRRTPRQLKYFALKTVASLRNDDETNSSVLEVVTPDRPGLLAHLAQIFVRFELRIVNAKISTLGERVEDIFYITDRDFEPLTNSDVCSDLTETICRELDQRNTEDGQDDQLRKMQVRN